jgi:predicted metal-dependent enzyme (double-stranded beta helix superfamily)
MRWQRLPGEGGFRVKRFLAGIVCGWLALAAALIAHTLWAQQNASGVVVQPQVLVDNQKVTIRRWTLAPGERSPVHTHTLDHVYVVIHGSKIREYLPDGTSHDDDQETGRAAFSPGVGKTHSFENIGTVPYEMVSIELKPAP